MNSPTWTYTISKNETFSENRLQVYEFDCSLLMPSIRNVSSWVELDTAKWSKQNWLRKQNVKCERVQNTFVHVLACWPGRLYGINVFVAMIYRNIRQHFGHLLVRFGQIYLQIIVDFDTRISETSSHSSIHSPLYQKVSTFRVLWVLWGIFVETILGGPWCVFVDRPCSISNNNEHKFGEKNSPKFSKNREWLKLPLGKGAPVSPTKRRFVDIHA